MQATKYMYVINLLPPGAKYDPEIQLEMLFFFSLVDIACANI